MYILLYRCMIILLVVCWSDKAVAKNQHRLFCHIVKKMADCSGHGLTFIPRLPRVIETLIFSGNNLRNVSKETFLNVSNLHLKKVRINDNKIETISKDAFEALSFVNILDLSGNHIPTSILKTCFHGLRKNKLNKLYLNKIGLHFLPNDMFEFLSNTSLKSLVLENNKIRTLNSSVLIPLNGLYSLSIKASGLQTVPDFCNRDIQSVVPYLQSLNLGDNEIDNVNMIHFPGRCLPRLSTLTLDKNYLEEIPNNTFSDLPRLVKLSIQHNKEKVIFKTLAFNSSSLKLLYLWNELKMFPNKGSKHPESYSDFKNMFKYCPNLDYLDLTKVTLTTNDGVFVFEMLKHLTKLKSLILQSTMLVTIPRGLFQKMPMLSVLNLQRCGIRKWDSDVFKHVTSVKCLYLNYNQIGLINKTSFPPEFIENIEHFSIGFNPYECTCNLQWFLEWSKRNTGKFLGPLRYYQCATPPNLSGISVFDCYISYANCHPLIIYIITAVCLTISVVIVLVILYRYRWNIRYYIYLMRAKRVYEQIPGDNTHFQYDAFIAYHADDSLWVFSKLIPYLEENQNFKLCLHDRDFDPGKLIVDNIAEKLATSRKIVVVLTKNFLRSHWCQFELQLAQAYSMEVGKLSLITLMLDDLKPHHMCKSLQVLLKTTTYIQWTDNKLGETMLWEKLTSAIKK